MEAARALPVKELRRFVCVPVFTLTEECEGGAERSVRRDIRQWKGREPLSYHYRPVIEPTTQTGFNYNLFPVVLDSKGRPWAVANNFLLSKLEAVARPNMKSFQSFAHDLGAYKEWLDQQNNPDDLLFHFPRLKLARVTYRYNSHLENRLRAREIEETMAKRRMGTVIALYRWMLEIKLFEPDYPPWQERSYLLSTKDKHGRSIQMPITTTDISIRAPKSDDPFEGTIQDGGKLRPLMRDEQLWVMEAVRALRNSEMQLLILFMLFTGARIQTACTLRVRHFTSENPRFSKALGGHYEVYKLKVGPSAGIDTKNDKEMVLHVPRALYEVMRTYAQSNRAKRRRERAAGGDNRNQYIFLTQQGSPYYTAKEEALAFKPDLKRRHEKVGGTVRQYLKEHLIPYIQQHNKKNFTFRIHDLRASYGMNQTEIQLALVEKGEITLHKARITVMALMGHESSATTDLYLDYRKMQAQAYAAIDGYGEQVEAWVANAMAGVGYNNE